MDSLVLARRRVGIVLEVLKGRASVPDACRKYGLTQEEFRRWVDDCNQGEIDARLLSLD